MNNLPTFLTLKPDFFIPLALILEKFIMTKIKKLKDFWVLDIDDIYENEETKNLF